MSTLDHDTGQAPKKLRFITSQGAPNPKRRRVTAACLTCRKRKTACSGEQPACHTCRQNKLDCAGYTKGAGEGNESTPAGSTLTAKEELDRTKDKKPSTRKRSYRHETIKGDHGSAVQVPRPPIPAARASFTSASNNGPDTSETLFSRPRNRMPYFRWLGPTAIMPGFKQMVVKVKGHEHGGRSSTDEGPISPSLSTTILNASQRATSIYSSTPMAVESDIRTPLALPFYDNSSMPPSELIMHLCETFFLHLACNFPFLQKARFLKDLEEKQVDAILVDAVCAMAARFSTHALLLQQTGDGPKLMPSDYGQSFASRAKAALTDTFAVPSVSAVQAALLLAYNEFGESRDSGLWMYLGISIRMAQDLGLQKLQGLRYEGRDGPTPKMVKISRTDKLAYRSEQSEDDPARISSATDPKDAQEQRAVERERIDTFWAVFFLDRVVSSGTGRRSTLRDNEIELSFPALECPSSDAGWPTPFPALIRIVHLYGRVADLLNSIKEPSDITNDTPKRLADMEARVTSFYQGLSPRLHFEAMNFHHYVKAGEGTNFILLHFWFHTLIVLLHQPTLLKTFEGKMLQLFPNSQQLSMSSAKTIADILSYSQLIDTKAILGNCFTTQPIYIAACCFLKETAERTATSASQSESQSRNASRATSPGKMNAMGENADASARFADAVKSESVLLKPTGGKASTSDLAGKTIAKHTLLATAASQHYQLCYRALESIETYWSGAKYILTVLDQKFKGVGDPLLYTVEEGESSLEQPIPEPSFTSPGWRRKHSFAPSQFTNQHGLRSFPNPLLQDKAQPIPGSSAHNVDHSQAIGWTLTGTLNSPSTNLAWHYPNNGVPAAGVVTNGDTQRSAGYQSGMPNSSATSSTSMARPRPSITNQPSYGPSGISDMGPSLAMSPGYQPQMSSLGSLGYQQQHDYGSTYGLSSDPYPLLPNRTSFTDMLIESQDVDMSLLGLDMLPWLETPDGDMMSMFDSTSHDLGASHLHHESQNPPQG